MKITLDFDKLTIGDLELLDRAGRGEPVTSEIIALLDRIVEGGVRHLPLSRLPEVVEALTDAIGQLTNPEGN